jgi:hypothetical protein
MRGGECVYRVWWGNLCERTAWKTGVKGRVILNSIFKKQDGGLDWINLTETRDMWLTFVNMVVNIRHP